MMFQQPYSLIPRPRGGLRTGHGLTHLYLQEINGGMNHFIVLWLQPSAGSSDQKVTQAPVVCVFVLAQEVIQLVGQLGLKKNCRNIFIARIFDLMDSQLPDKQGTKHTRWQYVLFSAHPPVEFFRYAPFLAVTFLSHRFCNAIVAFTIACLAPTPLLPHQILQWGAKSYSVASHAHLVHPVSFQCRNQSGYETAIQGMRMFLYTANSLAAITSWFVPLPPAAPVPSSCSSAAHTVSSDSPPSAGHWPAHHRVQQLQEENKIERDLNLNPTSTTSLTPS